MTAFNLLRRFNLIVNSWHGGQDFPTPAPPCLARLALRQGSAERLFYYHSAQLAQLLFAEAPRLFSHSSLTHMNSAFPFYHEHNE